MDEIISDMLLLFIFGGGHKLYARGIGEYQEGLGGLWGA
jgi:hypothetical protein